MSAPAGLAPEGLTVGLQIIGRLHADAAVLAAAAASETVCAVNAQNWRTPRPGIAGSS
jgi:Asp-tRNA(Asn)/Glu-tRNA(Gln) amidotransferase A subunit family amidase